MNETISLLSGDFLIFYHPDSKCYFAFSKVRYEQLLKEYNVKQLDGVEEDFTLYCHKISPLFDEVTIKMFPLLKSELQATTISTLHGGIFVHESIKF